VPGRKVSLTTHRGGEQHECSSESHHRRRGRRVVADWRGHRRHAGGTARGERREHHHNDLNVADEFYTNFGLNMVRNGNTLQLKTFGHDHAWGSAVEGKSKALHPLSFGCYAEDIARLKARIEGEGIKLIDPPPGFESNGFWFRNHENVLIEVKVGPK